jgi:hypothetical protein
MIDDEMNNLKKQLKDTQKQIDEIQNDCRHTETKLALVPNGTFKVVKKCVDCDATVGYPTTEERDEFLN